MELNYLKVFFEVAKAGRFTEAAKRLNISQSALSRSVALLEESQGVKLFERAKSGVTLTPTGVEVFRHCERLFQTVEKISEVCAGNQITAEGPLKFGTPDHVLSYLLAKPVQMFRRDFPRVIPSVTIGTPDEIINSLLEGTNEFGLLFAKVNYPQISYEPIREEPMALVVEAGVWRDNKAATTSETLDRVLESIGYISSIGAHTQVRASRVLKELFGKMPPIGFEANSQEAQKRVCLCGGGVAYLQKFMVEAEIQAGVLQEINVDFPHSFKFWLATRKGHTLSHPAKLFLDRLRAV